MGFQAPKGMKLDAMAIHEEKARAKALADTQKALSAKTLADLANRDRGVRNPSGN